MSEILWETTGQSASFTRNERPLGRYTWDSKWTQPFFHPLWTPHSPEPVTLFAPSDHPWHRGLWWSWKYINNVNFWDPHEKPESHYGYGESIVVAHNIEKEGHSAAISQQLELHETGTSRIIARETRRMVLHPCLDGAPDDEYFSAWAIDFDLSWQGEDELTFSTTQWPEKSWGGYGGLCFRPARALGADESLINSEGATNKASFHGQSARWAAYLGCCDNDDTARPWKSRRYGAAIFDHPSNPRHPQAFYTHLLCEDDQFFSVMKVAPLMHESLVLPAGESLRLRYRVALFDDWNDVVLRQTIFDTAWNVWSRS